MAAKKTERLLNLVICLLATRRYLSVRQIRSAVPGYDQGSEDAFRRMFERDKEELRELGVPLETGTDAAAHDDELGYRIARRDYELPPIDLSPDEAAALGLAARLWQSAPLAEATATGLLKLRAAGLEPPEPAGALEPRVAASEPAFPACLDAVQSSRAVTFAYRAAGRADAEEREVEPWGVVSWHGRWYLVGHDRQRQATRVFRLSRVLGPVCPVGPPGSVTPPPGLDLRAIVAKTEDQAPAAEATVRLRPGAAWGLRRRATSVRQAAPDSWDEISVGFSDPERLAAEVAGYGADAVAVDPPELRAAVIRRLESLAG